MAQLRARLAVFVRERRGALPQRAFARKTGLAQSTIMRIENQEQNVTLETLEQLCRVFHVDISELFPQRTSANRYPWLAPTAVQQAGMIHEGEVEPRGLTARGARDAVKGSGAATANPEKPKSKPGRSKPDKPGRPEPEKPEPEKPEPERPEKGSKKQGR